MRYKYVNNGSKKLVVVFQSAGRLPKEILDRILKKDISEEEVTKYHENYNWWKLSNNNWTDYIYIQDYYSDSYGWYMVDKGESIINKFNNELNDFIKKGNYNEVTLFGSSKGASAAILYGLINENINNVFALVPQVYVVNYINKYMNQYRELIFPNNNLCFESYINNIFFDKEIYMNKSKTNIYLYSGVNDDQFEGLIKLDNLLKENKINSNMIINISEKKHTPLVKDNVEFIYKMLEAIVNKSKVQENRLIKLSKGKFLLKDN